MEFVQGRSLGTIKRAVNVTDGPVMPHPSSSTGKKIKVSYVSVTFTLKGGEWEIDGWSGIHFSGTVLRKDGSEGKETWGGTAHYNWEKMPAYDWVRLLIDSLRPEGAPDMPFRIHGLENDELEG